MTLLDTHVLVWAIEKPALLSRTARRIFEHERVMVSAASLWELMVKGEKPGAPVRDPVAWWDAHVAGRGVETLNIDIRHVRRLAALPPLHRDPFDRLLLCQCIEEGLHLLTRDSALQRYAGLVKCIW